MEKIKWQLITNFQDFVERLTLGEHDFDTDQFRLALSNTAPTATQTVFIGSPAGLHPPPTNANGYTAGGGSPTMTVSETGGTTTVQATQVVFTASGGTIGTFRYVILYNQTASNNLVGWWDYGSSITLNDGETFTWKPNNASPGDVFTLT